MTVDCKERPALCRARTRRLALSVAALSLLVVGLRPAAAQPDARRIYVDQGCAVCHGLMGRGGVGPDFVGDHFLALGDYAIVQILVGRGQMPGFADKLSDEQIAAVATYIRQSWGNKLGELSPDQVKQLRAKIQNQH